MGRNVLSNIESGTNTVCVINRLWISYMANNIQDSVSGGALVRDTSASIPTVHRLIIGYQVEVSPKLQMGFSESHLQVPMQPLGHVMKFMSYQTTQRPQMLLKPETAQAESTSGANKSRPEVSPRP